MACRGWLLLLFLVAWAASAWAPYDRRDWLLEHVPTAGALVFLVWQERRARGRPLSDANCTLVFVFALLHVIGAYHLYSRVPYDAWTADLFGWRVSDWLGATRNHYDRFVHLCFGLCMTPPIAELVHRHVTRWAGWSVVVAIAFVGVVSKMYELVEWWIAVLMSPEAAEAYNGQQGDAFDAQKDMALALLGAIGSGACVWWRRAAAARNARAARTAPVLTRRV